MYLNIKKIFLIGSLLILAVITVFVWLNYHSAKKAFYKNLEETGERRAQELFLAIDMTENHLQQLATLLSSEKEVQNLLKAGRDAVIKEGGGPGGDLSEHYRKALFDTVKSRWAEVSSIYSLRQLHFLLDPGALSFLRVHNPDKFGDRLDDIRHTIADSTRLLQPTQGFEVGRIYSDIRGVVPVFWDDGNTEKTLIGTLDAGTPFSLLLKHLKQQSGADYAVLLDLDIVKTKVWPESLQKLKEEGQIVGSYVIEATTDTNALRNLLTNLRDKKQSVVLCECNKRGNTHAIKRVNLRDYQGTIDSNIPDIGEIIIWFDATNAVNNFWSRGRFIIFYWILGFIFLEALLYFSLRGVTIGLHQTINDQRLELEKSLSLALFSEKMASVGQLAAGVAHEINNPIGFVSSNLSSLKKYMAKLTDFIAELQRSSPVDTETLKAIKKTHKVDFILEDINDLITESLDGTSRVSEIVADLKGFAHQDPDDKNHQTNLNDCIEQSIKLTHNELKYKAEIIKDYHCIPLLKCNSNQLSQVFVNLLVNAAQAIENHGTIHISTQQEDGAIVIKIKDSGCGMDRETIKNLFTPFYTTKEVGKGTGLGLSVCYDIIKSYGGTIEAQSAPGEGTTFIIKLPVIDN